MRTLNYRLYEEDSAPASIVYQYDIIKNTNSESSNFGNKGLVMNATSKGAYVMYFKYNPRKKRTEEIGIEWEQFEDLEVVGTLGQFDSTVAAQPASAPSTTTQAAEEEPAVAAPAIDRTPKAPRKPRANKQAGIINSLSNDQILAYNESNISADEQDRIAKFVQSFNDAKTAGNYWGRSKQIFYPSSVVFTGNGKYKRNVLAAAARAAGAEVLPQVQKRAGGYSYRNFLVVSNKSGKDLSDTTKMRLAQERGWNIISEDGFLKLLQEQDPDIITKVCDAMKSAISGTSAE